MERWKTSRATLSRTWDACGLPDTEIDVDRLMNKDSLEMTDADRARVLQAVKERLNAPIVITHGTDTMVETDFYLKARLGQVRFPIVLTGAMTPLGFESSDGLQNLTESFFAARVLEPGDLRGDAQSGVSGSSP